jgi:transcriptional regulator with XRE-family HTH domain
MRHWKDLNEDLVMAEPTSALGRTIRHARQAQRLTAYETARRTGIVHRATIQRIETGDITRPRPETLRSIAEVLELDLDDLLALAGYVRASELPDFEPYLRAKHADLPEEAIAQLVGHFELIADKYRSNEEAA